VVGIDENFEVIVKVLSDISPEFRGNDAGWIGIIAMDSKVDSVACIQNANLGFLGSWLAFVWFALTEVGNRNGRLPQWVIKRAIEFWRALDWSGLRVLVISLNSRDLR
jgi:hypothetical protein